MRDKRQGHRTYIRRRGEDMPEIRDWQWKHDPAIFDMVPPEFGW